jgi:SNF2 family DNA or RNA helicase
VAKELRKYQAEDSAYIAGRKSALIAHEPRVGKSGIVIDAANRIHAKLVVIVCPANVKENWRVAVEDFRRSGWTAVIVSYNKAPRVLKVLRKKRIDVLVVDESQYCKERSTQRTKIVYGTMCDRHGGLAEMADRIYCLTGTPMPNNPTELWPMLRALAPELIDNGRGRPMSWSSFRDRYCKMVNTPYGVKIAGSKNYGELKKKLEGFVIRRKRVDVFGRDMLPPTKVYVRAGADYRKDLDALASSEQGKLVQQALKSSNPLRALAKQEKHVAGLRKLFGLAKVPGIVGMVAEELDAEPKEKVVLFAFHHVVMDALKRGLKKYGVELYDGRTSSERKVRIERRLHTDPKLRVIVAQIHAAGVGLDFSAANNVIFVEQSWTGDDNEQARSRVFNMNSLEPKFTRFAVLTGSLDEQIAAACERKLADTRRVFS